MNYNTTALPRIINSKDPITGRKLVRFSQGLGRYRVNLKIPKCRIGEEHLVENYDLAKNDNFKGWVLHHRLELTLDGEFANSAMDLVNKDMYYHRPHFELIWLRVNDHMKLHSKMNLNVNWSENPTESAKRQRERKAKKRSV